MESSSVEWDAKGEASADVTLTQGSLHGHPSLQLVLAQPYQPTALCQLSDFLTPSLPSVLTTEENTVQGCPLGAFRAECTITRTKIRAFRRAALQLPLQGFAEQVGAEAEGEEQLLFPLEGSGVHSTKAAFSRR